MLAKLFRHYRFYITRARTVIYCVSFLLLLLEYQVASATAIINVEWDKAFGGNNWDHAHSIVQTQDGGFAIAGTTFSKGAGSTDIWIIRLDSNGNLLWEKTFGGSNAENSEKIQLRFDNTPLSRRPFPNLNSRKAVGGRSNCSD